MSMSDPIADMLTRIRNASTAGLPEVAMPASNLKAAVAEVLREQGYTGESRIENEGTIDRSLVIELKYRGKQRLPVIEGMQRVSRPSCRVYAGSGGIPRVLGGLGIAVLSTSKGIMTDRAARKQNVGGEILCYVW
ncbi:MAG: 30S ribosomal protein S8 [Lentisphaeria bacterium]|nr:30S ribosomal protein S8 [Lentisphaeria bacterium]